MPSFAILKNNAWRLTESKAFLKSAKIVWTGFRKLLFLDQWRNVACWRPSAPTAPPVFGAPPQLKIKGKIEQLKLF